MRTNKTLRIASVLLIAVLMTTCIIGGTFAKYTSNATATAVGSVATWSIKVNNSTIGDNTSIDVDLTTTVFENGDGEVADDEVVAGKMAPGTKGAFAIEIANESEVDAVAVVKIDVTALPVNVVITGGQASTEEIEGVEHKFLTFTTAQMDYKSGDTVDSETVTVAWAWAFGEDVDDNAAAGEFELPITITVSQVD